MMMMLLRCDLRCRMLEALELPRLFQLVHPHSPHWQGKSNVPPHSVALGEDLLSTTAFRLPISLVIFCSYLIAPTTLGSPSLTFGSI